MILISRFSTLTTIILGLFFVFWLSVVVDSLTHKIHKGNTITGIGFGTLIVLLVSLIWYFKMDLVLLRHITA
ncbi:hypothetical protein [Helicobacter equorum]|uniref:hypothetical protein n=1 Tax=Helicobacter equorum TaxID=361872 RepID=UPI001315352B|nr:hypothetical protein [Helicobacter equorum]